VFIDDPVSSLDENHLIELAVNLAGLIKTSQSTDLKFIVASHSTLSNEAIAQPTPAVQATVKLLLDNLKNSHGFWQQQGA
jgi:wobble nucleotide-excising tRNase